MYWRSHIQVLSGFDNVYSFLRDRGLLQLKVVLASVVLLNTYMIGFISSKGFLLAILIENRFPHSLEIMGFVAAPESPFLIYIGHYIYI